MSTKCAWVEGPSPEIERLEFEARQETEHQQAQARIIRFLEKAERHLRAELEDPATLEVAQKEYIDASYKTKCAKLEMKLNSWFIYRYKLSIIQKITKTAF